MMIDIRQHTHTHWLRGCYLVMLLVAGCGGVSSDIQPTIPLDVTVVNLSVTPAASKLPVGFSLQIKAEALLSDNRVLDVTAYNDVTWSSSNPAIATIISSGEDKGMVTGVSTGTVTITASGEANGQTFSGTADVTITDAVVSSLQITPYVNVLPVGLSVQLKSEAIMSDGQVLDVTDNDTVSWRSSNPAIATIINSGEDKGMVTGVSAGTVTITASGEANGQTFSRTADVTITDAVVSSLQITPYVNVLPVGLSVQLKSEAIMSDGQVLDVTDNDTVSWRSSNPAIATIINSGEDKGMVTGVSAGSVTITASGEANGQTFSRTADVTITDAVVSSLQITPYVNVLPVGLSVQLKSEAIMSDGQVMDVTDNDTVSWRSSSPAIATIISSGEDKGMVTGVSTGTVTITASGEANGQTFSGTADVTITDAVVSSLQITPYVNVLPVGLSVQLKSEAIMSDGQVLDVTDNDTVSWRSSSPAIATIISSGEDKGMVTGVSTGTVTITASGEANGQTFSGTADVTITDAVVSSLQITPYVNILPVGLSVQLKSEAIMSDGQVLDVTDNDTVSWRSSNPAIATIINSGEDKGMVTGVSAGSVTITASGEANGQTFSRTADVTITDAVVSSLQITPYVNVLPVGLSVQLKSEAIMSDGQVLDVTDNDTVSWRSSNPAIATIISSGEDKGMVTGVSAGTVTITASGEANGQTFSGTADVTITDAVVSSLQITPYVNVLPVGLSVQLKSEAIMSDGQVLDVTDNDTVSWRSSNPAIATIINSGEDKGMVTGVSTGTVTITVSGEANGQTFSGTADVTITDAVVSSIKITPDVYDLPIGVSVQLKGVAIMSDGQVLDVTDNDAVSWRSSNPDIATIISSGEDKGMVTGVSAGTVTITTTNATYSQQFSASAKVEVKALLAFFTTPDTMIRSWNDADAYCKGLAPGAYQLPSYQELQNLFIQSTSATVLGQANYEMCDVHGWPLLGCGGSKTLYWAREATGTGSHWYVYMDTGRANINVDTDGLQVTCVLKAP
ncbi:intimin/invasin family protein [Aeromonas salmonicida]|uniref:Ig-like domain-containing protein n=1 Tax=Aeromonas salmonicida TaxID=645 RepID=UPI001026E595|nr:Ig-like domain-containing protein [Aeromonas salmonicida]VFB09619.1 intimin/invasin family protein [Aeromonas salmonicida]